MRKSGRGRPSGKRGRAVALCALGAAVCIICALFLSKMFVAPLIRGAFALERAEADGSYILNGGGFVTTIHMEKIGDAGMGKETAAKMARLSNSVPEPTQEPQVKFHAKEVTQGKYYDTLMAQVAADEASLIAPAHVIELTASLEGKKLDLSGCEITLQVDPAPALVEAAMEEGVSVAGLDDEDGGGNGKQPGMIVTVQPLGGEAVTRLFTSEELESGWPVPVDVTYTVPSGVPIMYAVSARAIEDGAIILNGADAALNVSLLYGDQKEQGAYPDGFEYYTTSTMSGYIKLEPSGLTEDLENVYVTLAIPKEYVEKGSINIPRFNSSSSVTEYEIIPVKEEGKNYCVRIHFKKYDKTQTLVLPFALSFLDKVVPSNYELPVTTSVSCGGPIITTEPNIYKPKYEDWGIDKFVNSNKLNTFKDDGAEVVVTAQEEGGNPYLDDKTYVDFAFRVNNVINSGSDLNNYRDATSVTLTDTLPTYKDKDGNTRTAVFDQDVNPGWKLSEDGKTVAKTYSGKDSSDVLNQIYGDDPLKLRFPNLKFEGENGKLSISLNNMVNLVAEPSNRGNGEPNITANDPLRFVMTTEAGTKGSFTKTAQKGKIYDTDTYKTNPYPWRVRLSNNGAQPLEHIVIQDRKIVENGKVVLAGMNEDLKFVRLTSDLGDSSPATGRTFADMVEKVVAYYTDGTIQNYSITVDENGNFTIEFDRSKVCNGYEIIFKDDFKLLSAEAVSFMAYTIYRDPQNTHVPEGQESIRYDNTARAVNSYMQGGQRVNSYLTVTHGYDMLPVTENLEIGKQTYLNNATENNRVGSVYRYWISVAGSLAKGKEYEPIYIVDLLPNEVDFVEVTHGKEMFDGGSVTPKQVENYHNSGRTALIWELPYDALMKHLGDSGHNNLYYVCIQFSVKIREDAHPGTVTNNIYIVGDNLEEYTGKTGGAVDIYDLDNDGRTDDMIAWSSSDATIMTAASAYAEKFIAPADSDNWSRQGLSMTLGTDFDYLLKVTNELDDQTGLVVYDTLPAVGDKGVFGVNPRNSEFPVRLRGAITPPDGYTVYYTTDEAVYSSSMNAMVDDAEIWFTANGNTDWSAVTAFKLVADKEKKLRKGDVFQVQVPVCVPNQLGTFNLNAKTYEDQTSGTMAYLEANNNFGFKTHEWTKPRESNTVWARVPFAGFVIQKVDGESKQGLAGAEFTLTDSDGMPIQSGTSDENGRLEFNDLTAGTYTLTETEVPTGYLDNKLSLTVTITQNPVTMEYTVQFSGNKGLTGTGTSADPLQVENAKNDYELPETGRTGPLLSSIGGLVLLSCAGVLLYDNRLKRKREKF